jgi:transposase
MGKGPCSRERRAAKPNLDVPQAHGTYRRTKFTAGDSQCEPPADTGTQSKMSTTVKNSKMARRYGEEFKRQAVELMIHSGKTQRQVARELDVSEYSLNLWKKAYLGQQKPAEIDGEMKSPEEMAKIIREQHKEIEYLKRQREILKKTMSILGEEPNPGMR